MAAYGVSLKGSHALHQLDMDMLRLTQDIEDSVKTLKSTVMGLDDGLGEFSEEIMDMIGEVERDFEKAKEPIEDLRKNIQRQRNRIGILLGAK